MDHAVLPYHEKNKPDVACFAYLQLFYNFLWFGCNRRLKILLELLDAWSKQPYPTYTSLSWHFEVVVAVTPYYFCSFFLQH